jgi:hypothetical protein
MTLCCLYSTQEKAQNMTDMNKSNAALEAFLEVHEAADAAKAARDAAQEAAKAAYDAADAAYDAALNAALEAYDAARNVALEAAEAAALEEAA